MKMDGFHFAEFCEHDREWTVNGGCRYNYHEHRMPVSAIALGPSVQTGYQMAVGSSDGYICLRPPGNRPAHTYWRCGGPSSVLSLAFSSQVCEVVREPGRSVGPKVQGRVRVNQFRRFRKQGFIRPPSKIFVTYYYKSYCFQYSVIH